MKTYCKRCGIYRDKCSTNRWKDPICMVGNSHYDQHVFETAPPKSNEEMLQYTFKARDCVADEYVMPLRRVKLLLEAKDAQRDQAVREAVIENTKLLTPRIGSASQIALDWLREDREALCEIHKSETALVIIKKPALTTQDKVVLPTSK